MKILKNKGSALVLTLLAMSLLVILGLSLIQVTYSENRMSKLYENKTSNYYVAESGIERATSIINNAVKVRADRIEEYSKVMGEEYAKTHTGPETISYLKTSVIFSALDTDIKNYFLASDKQIVCDRDYSGTSFPSFSINIDKYQRYTADNSNDGTDTRDFKIRYGMSCYYVVTVGNVKNLSDGSGWAVTLTSTGHYGSAQKSITLDYIIKVPYQDPTFTPNNDYSDFDVFTKNALTSIDNSYDFNAQKALTINGNVLIEAKSMNLKKDASFTGDTVIKTTGNINLKKDFSQNNNSSDILLDAPIIDVEKGFSIPPGDTLYISHGSTFNLKKGDSISKSYLDDYMGSVPLVTQNNYKRIPDYSIKPIVNTASFKGVENNINYIFCKSDGTFSSPISSTLLNVFIINDDSIANNKGNKNQEYTLDFGNHNPINAFIYSTRRVNFGSKDVTINGMIISNGIGSISKNLTINDTLTTQQISLIKTKITSNIDNTGSGASITVQLIPNITKQNWSEK